MKLGCQFTWWCAPIPISTNAKYILLNTIPGESEKDDSYLALLDANTRNIINCLI